MRKRSCNSRNALTLCSCCDKISCAAGSIRCNSCNVRPTTPACVSSEVSFSASKSSAAWLEFKQFARRCWRVDNPARSVRPRPVAVARRADFVHLKSQQVELLRVGFFVDDQRRLFRSPAPTASARNSPNASRCDCNRRRRRESRVAWARAAAIDARAVHEYPPAIRRWSPAPRASSASH